MQTSTVSDEYFEAVARELTSGYRDEGLWLKAFSLEDGDENRAKAHYIRLRVSKLSHEADSALEPQPQPQPQPQPNEIEAPHSPPPVTDSRSIDSSRKTLSDETLYEAAIGKNVEYYTAQFIHFDETGQQRSWNWAAFFLNASWLLYRKLWGASVVYVLVASVISGIFGKAPFVELSLLLVWTGYFASKSNYWYYNKIRKIIASERDVSASDVGAIPAIRRRGGITWLPAYLAVGVVAIGIIAAIAIPAKKKNTTSSDNAPPSEQMATPLSRKSDPVQSSSVRWTPISKIENGTAYADPSSKKRFGDIALVTVLDDYDTPETSSSGAYQSDILTWSVDCAHRKVLMNDLATYSGRMGTGVVTSATTFDNDAKSFTAGTASEKVFDFACS